jgi:hypothetical protein
MTYKLQPLTDRDKDPTTDVRAILTDEYGGTVRIIVDDHCYVLQQLVPDGPGYKWINVTHWFREAARELHVLMELEVLGTVGDLQSAQNVVYEAEQRLVDEAAKVVSRRTGKPFKISLGEVK